MRAGIPGDLVPDDRARPRDHREHPPGQLRVDGARATPGDRLTVGQVLRVPPVEAAPKTTAKPRVNRPKLSAEQTEFAQEMVTDPVLFTQVKAGAALERFWVNAPVAVAVQAVPTVPVSVRVTVVVWPA